MLCHARRGDDAITMRLTADENRSNEAHGVDAEQGAPFEGLGSPVSQKVRDTCAE